MTRPFFWNRPLIAWAARDLGASAFFRFAAVRLPGAPGDPGDPGAAAGPKLAPGLRAMGRAVPGSRGASGDARRLGTAAGGRGPGTRPDRGRRATPAAAGVGGGPRAGRSLDRGGGGCRFGFGRGLAGRRAAAPPRGSTLGNRRTIPGTATQPLRLDGCIPLDFKVVGYLPRPRLPALHDGVVLNRQDAFLLLGLAADQATDLALEVFHEEEAEALRPDLARALPWPVSITTSREQLRRQLDDINRRTGWLLASFVPALAAMALAGGAPWAPRAAGNAGKWACSRPWAGVAAIFCGCTSIAGC